MANRKGDKTELCINPNFTAHIYESTQSHFTIEEQFLSRVSILTRDIDIANLSVCLSALLSVRNVPVSDENGLTYRHSFFHHTVAQSF